MMTKHKKNDKVPGTIYISYRDENGRKGFVWDANRSGKNVENGIYEMLEFFKDKYSIDLVKLIEEHKKNNRELIEKYNKDKDTTDE